jgi:protein-S-isoprenylcysteine O-methyltransferase Ste14
MYILLASITFLIYVFIRIISEKYLNSFKKLQVFCHVFFAALAILTFFTLFIGFKIYSTFTLIIGTLFLSLGSILIILSIIKLKLQMFGINNKLIKDGIYAYLKNPLYIGKILFVYGTFIITFKLNYFIYSLIVFGGYFIITLWEIKNLRKKLGLPYIFYLKNK